ncbi:MAG: amidohydrolase/deacetylase family metallohydrolase [Chloroflexi bacterium]|nr:amidohydrolase/deacetylase family metallohydrolase [Chloroflexota bacterium]MDA1227130.1 amidohydrolase/deacetylase family metallohydrolase [Chloroflexota bacterium]
MTDLLLKGGEVIDPAQNIRAKLDVAVKDGVISQVAADIDPSGFAQVINVAGNIVIPGMIDLHTHVYEGVNQTGVSPDIAGVRSGVTTVVDAGSSGCYSFGGFPKFVVPNNKTRIVCMLHISRVGLIYQPDTASRADIDVEETVRVIKANRPLIQGVKIRAVGPGVRDMGIEMIKLAKQAATEGGVRLMVHIGDRTIASGGGPTLTQELLPLLEKGDIITHLFSGNPGRIVGDDGKVIPEILEAQERGVFLDTAHGRQNFSFDVAKRAVEGGVKPLSISTDLTIPGRQLTVHSMTEMLSRFLALGFPLEEVVRMSTINPASALNMQDTLGTLQVGRLADISVLKEETGDWVFHDTQGDTLRGDKAMVPVVTIKDGEVFAPDWGPRPWGWLPDSA